MPDRYDVAIMGGGLAGLTLALQLGRERPATSIAVVEKRAGPAPEAAFKVGESTVELSAFYFGEVLGLRDHLEESQLPKIGLRFFFPSDGNEDLALRPEWGSVEPPPVPSYQLDRGRFENELTARNRSREGTVVLDGCTVEDVALSDDGDHVLTLSGGGAAETVLVRWVIDATGYSQLLKRKLGLEEPVAHTINACWMRVSDELDIESWVDDDAWLARMARPGLRRLSTNHLMGEGYWVWLIPLASGSTSVGIVADPRFHAWDEINTLERALDWLKAHEPQLARELHAKREAVEDFLKVEDFAYSCRQVFSPARWAMTGVSGVFLDPFYSPGSDFIAFANTYITDLVKRDLDGAHDPERVATLNGAFLQIFQGVLDLYVDKYELWGDPLPMSAKVGWDFAFYWTVLVPPFTHGKWQDLEFAAAAGETLGRCIGLSHAVQRLCRDWHRLGAPQPRGGFAAVKYFDALYELHVGLRERFADTPELVEALEHKAEILRGLAVTIFHKAAESLGERAPDPSARIEPNAISLDPDRWENDGLLAPSGLTLDEALARVPGVEQLWFVGAEYEAA